MDTVIVHLHAQLAYIYKEIPVNHVHHIVEPVNLVEIVLFYET